MAKATLPAEEQTDAPVAGPVELLALLTSGATFAGVAVRTLRVELADGRVQRIELPEAAGDLSDLAGRLLESLRDMPAGDWTSGAALARMVDPDGDLESHSGSFKRAMEELRKARLIEGSRKGYRAK